MTIISATIKIIYIRDAKKRFIFLRRYDAITRSQTTHREYRRAVFTLIITGHSAAIFVIKKGRRSKDREFSF